MAEETTDTHLSQEHFIDYLSIENFKSIRKLELHPKRINLFVGRPNAGKSNILEAIEVWGNAYIRVHVIRIEKIENIFFDNDVNNEIRITNGNKALYVYFNQARSRILFSGIGYKDGDIAFLGGGVEVDLNLQFHNTNGIIPGLGRTISNEFTNIKFFKYNDDVFLRKPSYHSQASFLVPPHGENLSRLLTSNGSCRAIASEMIGDYDLFLLQRRDDTFLISKIDGNVLIEFPSWLLADTLKRQLFFRLATNSNTYSNLLFEEPESHSYPPYVKILAEEISAAKTNQFFIATHSPYLLETLYENAEDGELQVYAVDYQNHQTVVFPIDNDALGELIANRADVFFNLQNFTA